MSESLSRQVSPGSTRDCTDPWEYLEFRVDGDVGPCCVRTVGNLGTHSLGDITNGAAMRDLRADLLRGTPDATCRACGLRGELDTGMFQLKIRTLLDQLEPPVLFDPSDYLRANPDVAAARVDPLRHYLDHGRFEGRAIRPD